MSQYNRSSSSSNSSTQSESDKCSACCPPPQGPIFAMNPQRCVPTWKINYLISNRPNEGAHQDTDLVNPWGIVVYNSQIWVVAGSTDNILNYDLYGNKLLGSITVRDARHNSSHPCGIAVNCGGGFPVSANGVTTTTKAATFVVASEHGTVHGFNPEVDSQNAYIALNLQLTGDVHVFKGLTIVNDILYLANFFQRRIQVFDSNYRPLPGYPFVDGETCDPIPVDFAPNNIVGIGCYLYVLWARKDPNITVHDLDGPGNGYISVFNLDGSFVRRFTSRGVLNSPWAMIPAPCDCGFPPNSFLVGNNGDGRINIFDCNGRYVGPLLNQNATPIVLGGLWGLAANYTPNRIEIFFASAPDEDIDGLVGSIVKDQIICFG